MPSIQETWGFVPFAGDYEKKFYDVRIVKRRDASGKSIEFEVVGHCWPNSGYLNETRGAQRRWGPESNVEFRLSATHPMWGPQE